MPPHLSTAATLPPLPSLCNLSTLGYSTFSSSPTLPAPSFHAIDMVAGVLRTLGLRPTMCAPCTSDRRTGPRVACPARLHAQSFPSASPIHAFAAPRRVLRPLMAAGRSDQVDESGNQHSRVTASAKPFCWTGLLLDFTVNNFLPLALISGIALGLANPSLGCLAQKFSLSRVSTSGIFFISGLTLQSREIGAAIEAWPAAILGLSSILLFTPFFSRLILQIQLTPQEFVTGLAIFCCMPTTLSSGVALTQLVGGNSALALAMTVTSNLLGILLVPFSLAKFIGAGAGVSVPAMQLFKSLISTLLVPLVLGKVTRDTFSYVSEFVDRNRRVFSMISAIFLSLVPWIQVSRSRSLLLTVQPAIFSIAIIMGMVLHIILLALNSLAVQSLSIVSGDNKSVFAKKENARSVIIVASQKTLPVMVAVVEQLGGKLGEPGLLVLPCVASHINQIIIDSFLVNLWLRKDQLSAKSKA